MNLTLQCFTDGCRKKDGRGGWGYLYYYNGDTYFAGGHLDGVTNNIAELKGPIELLEKLARHSWVGEQPIQIISDSQYFVKGLNTWMHSWHAKGWNRGSTYHHKEVSNLEMWKELFNFHTIYNIKAKWVRGHDGHIENIMCDTIANYCCIHKVNIEGSIPTSLTNNVLGAHELSSFVKN